MKTLIYTFFVTLTWVTECLHASNHVSNSRNSIMPEELTKIEKEKERVSDPHIWTEAENWNPPSPDIVLPPGKPDTIETDIPGPPLTPDDFQRGRIMVFNPIDPSKQPDPIEFAGLYEGDIDIQNMDMIDLPTKDFPAAMHDFKFDNQSEQKKRFLLLENEIPMMRSAINDVGRRWPNGVVPYALSKKYNEQERAVIAKAITQFQENTCINFVPRIVETDYIHILKGDGCSSSVGKIGGPQKLSLGPGCVHEGVIMHEFMHSLGFWHEQSREDREKFIEIIWPNIIDGMKYNFQKYNNKIIQSLGKYDTGSVMHYGPYAFAKDRARPTIIARNGGEIGQRRGFSKNDILKVQELYKCNNESYVTETPVSTQSPDMCEDSHKYCPTWAADDECAKNSLWMGVYCMKSCNQCNSECKDRSPFCEYWSKKDECKKNPIYMLHFCKKSCGICHSVTDYGDAICEDMNAYCDVWAQSGQCHINPTYMLKYCRRACKECAN